MNARSQLLLQAQMRTDAIASVWAGTVWIQASALAELAGCGIAQVEAWIASGELVSLPLDGQHYIPAYSVDLHFQPLPCIASIIRIFHGGCSNLSLACWFESTSGFLRGRRPREIIARDPQRAVLAAQNSADNETTA